MLVLLLGLLITASLAFIVATVNNRNENRLLNVQVHEAGTVLAGAIPTIEVPLASGAAIAVTDNGGAGQFDQFMVNYVGTGHPFVYASLCGIANGAPVRLASVGKPSPAPAGISSECSFLTRSAGSPALSITGLIAGGTRVGYTYLATGKVPKFGVYAEGLLPPNKRVAIPTGSSFSDLDFALYLGRSQRNGDLLESTVAHLPIVGRQAVATVPFANTALTLVGTSTQPLGGSLSRDLTFIVSVLGVILTIGATLLTERLVRRRRSAEDLAEENRRLYGEQRSLAATLQRALLPKETPIFRGIEIDSRYVAGLSAMDIGGDWFDVIPRNDNSFLFVVGDVSGRGVRAAIVMASLHYAVRAYAAEGDQPGTVLTKLGALLDVHRDSHLATVLCGFVDIDKHEMTLASAGHFPPLVVSNGQGSYVELAVGLPIGTGEGETYASTTIEVPPGATVLAFTDGLVERRKEAIDVGLDRLRDAAAEDDRSLSQLLGEVIDRLTPDGSEDDTAILGLRWQN
ncbi:MAG TPA: PP2C family protein-serine/threonine phosphatase [Acidimicrobiales bacterium]|nr:PP2C family protein-serine/threonine phosphatase [Acidimicrobiales bacterium]